ncbi:MAG: thioredoxin-disulfide reductase [Clostridiales bacterium]|nr:thioredoxin-disulfide reductase [Clostridiales bacterium]
MENIYDVIIIGGGPAGLSAGLYAARSKMSTLVLEKESAGGQMAITNEIANYPGSIENATGSTLANRMMEQCKEFGVEFKIDQVTKVELDGDIKKITGENQVYKSRTVIIASGATPRPLNVPGEKDFVGKGVSYCATCDADFFTGLEVFVIGGGDAAVQEAIHLTKFARKVTIVHRRDELRAAKSIQDRAMKNPKIEFMWDTIVEEIKGDGIVNSILLKNVKTNELNEYKANPNEGTFGIFVFIGFLPHTQLFADIIDLDEMGYIITDENMKTNIPGVFAAGDCRKKSLRQVVTAVGDGAIAAVQAEAYIQEKFN